MEMTQQFLIKIKKLSGYSFSQLAKRTGLHRSHLYRIYPRTTGMPNHSTICSRPYRRLLRQPQCQGSPWTHTLIQAHRVLRPLDRR